jgi:hypothetical protein
MRGKGINRLFPRDQVKKEKQLEDKERNKNIRCYMPQETHKEHKEKRNTQYSYF